MIIVAAKGVARKLRGGTVFYLNSLFIQDVAEEAIIGSCVLVYS